MLAFSKPPLPFGLNQRLASFLTIEDLDRSDDTHQIQDLENTAVTPVLPRFGIKCAKLGSGSGRRFLFQDESTPRLERELFRMSWR